MPFKLKDLQVKNTAAFNGIMSMEKASADYYVICGSRPVIGMSDFF